MLFLRYVRLIRDQGKPHRLLQEAVVASRFLLLWFRHARDLPLSVYAQIHDCPIPGAFSTRLTPIMHLTTARSRVGLYLVVIVLATCAPGAGAQSAEADSSSVGGWFRNLGKGIDNALQGGAQGGQGAVDGVNRAHAAVNGQVRGRARLQGGRTLTCFHGITACYLGPANMTSPGQSQGVPLLLVLADGRAMANNADQLESAGVLVLPTPQSGARGDTGYSDGLGCTDPSWTKDEIVRRRREIMDCQADAITERAAQREKLRRDQDAATRQRAQQQLEADTRSKFEAIQRDAAQPKP